MEYKYTLEIHGMMCGMCETHINDVIRNNFNVKKVTSSHLKNETIIISKTELDEEKLASAIKETGYELKGIKKEEAEEKKSFIAKLFKK